MSQKENLIIGQFNDSFPPVMDGVANVVRNYAYWLQKKYGECYVATPAFPDYVDHETYPVLRYHSMPLKGYEPYRVGLNMLDLNFRTTIRSIPFDIIHAHAPFSSGAVALQVAKKKEIPIIATFHSKFYDDFKEVLKLDSFARIGTKLVIDWFKKVDQVWAVSHSTADTLREYGFKKKIEVVPNGCDIVPESVDAETMERVTTKYNLHPEDFVLLFVGQHIRQKNTMLLIDSLAQLKQLGLRFTMLFVGIGTAREEMEQRVQESGLSDSVHFLGSIAERETLAAIYARANLFTFPSVYDNAPLVVREAAAMGTPALLISGSNSAEGVTDAVNGFLTEETPEAIAQKIFDISKMGDISEIGNAAAKTLYRNWEGIVDEVYLRYLEIIAWKKRKSARY